MRPHHLALPPPNQKAMTPKPHKRFLPHLHWPGPEANTFPLREVAGPEGPTWVHVPFSISDMTQIEKKKNWDPFQKILLDTEKKFLCLTQTYNLT